MVSQEQASKNNLGLSAQCKPWLCCVKYAIFEDLETPKIEYFPGAVPLDHPVGDWTPLDPQADFLGCHTQTPKEPADKKALVFRHDKHINKIF